MSKKFDPQRLVPLTREVKFDDTLRDVNAILRFDTKIENSDLKTQLLVDFRHKKDKWKSKPFFYGTMSQPQQFQDLVTASLAMACFNRLRKKPKLTKEEIWAIYDDLVKWVREDVRHLVQILAQDVEIRQTKLLLKA